MKGKSPDGRRLVSMTMATVLGLVELLFFGADFVHLSKLSEVERRLG